MKTTSEINQTLFKNNKGILPLIISPAVQNVDLKSWISDNREQIESSLLKHGGILFRGFEINTIESFNSLMKCFSNDPIPYMFRSSPRHSITERVYVSTTHPKNRTINM